MDPRVKPAGDAFGMLSETARLELSATVTARMRFPPCGACAMRLVRINPPQDW
jgi:hypothetical protein